MFRQRLQEKEPEGDWFVNRVYDLPLVNSAVGQLGSLYTGVKQHNRLFRFTLDTAEGGVQVVVDRTRPVVAKFDKPIGTLNSLACQKLDQLETDYPIITRPTDEVLKETKELCGSAVKPLVDRVSAVKQYGIDKVYGVKSCATEKVTDAKTYGQNTLSAVTELGTKQVERVLEIPVCRQMVTGLDAVLDVADQYVDTYLPEADDDDDDTEMKPSSERKSSEEQFVVVGKARRITNKVRRRMYARISSRLRTVQLRSKETISHLHFTVDLIEYSRDSMNTAVDKAKYVWTEINKTEDEVARELTDEDSEARVHSDTTFERKVIATARHLTQRTKHAFGGVGTMVDVLPDDVYSRLQPVRDVRQYLGNNLRMPSAADISALTNYVTNVVNQYHVFVYSKCSSVIHWVVSFETVKTWVPSAVDRLGPNVDATELKPMDADRGPVDEKLEDDDELSPTDQQQQQPVEYDDNSGHDDDDDDENDKHDEDTEEERDVPANMDP